jgi:hypothetical protein
MVALPLLSGTLAERRDHLFGSYVNQMIRRHAAQCPYTPKQTVGWLSWLASQMAKHGQTVFYLEGLQLDWLTNRRRWVVHVCNALVGVLVGALFAGLHWPYARDVGLVFGLIGGLVVGLHGMLGEAISCAETVRWSWQGFWRNMLVFGLVVALVVGLVLGLIGGLVRGLVVGLVVLLLFGLTFGLLRGLTFGEIETRTLPNEGIRRSARNAFFVTMFGVLIGGPVVGWVVELVGRQRVGWVLGWSLGGLVGLVVGLVGGLHAGGDACLRHFVLRLWLIRNGSTPWNYVRFLDHAAERILLRKVGGGYAFIHRMLLDYFAARYVEPSSGDPRPAKPSSTKDQLQTA